MTAADSTWLVGGQTGVSGIVILGGADKDANTWIEIRCPVHFYEAKISAQAILSYNWLDSQNLMNDPRKHGLRFTDPDVDLFIPGLGRK